MVRLAERMAEVASSAPKLRSKSSKLPKMESLAAASISSLLSFRASCTRFSVSVPFFSASLVRETSSPASVRDSCRSG